MDTFYHSIDTSKLFAKKLVSQEPDQYDFKPLSRLIVDYANYVYFCKIQAQKEPTLTKTFDEWLLTEI